MRPDRYFLFAGLLCSLAFAVLTPPFQVPDEPAHFCRAYAVSEGHFVPRRTASGLGDRLPAGIAAVSSAFGDLPGHPERRLDTRRIASAFEISLEDWKRRFVDFRTAAQYSAVPYLPQAAGIAVVRPLGASPLSMLYAARIANVIAGTMLIVIGLSVLPSYRWVTALVALTPMALFLRGSASADSVTIGAGFLFAASFASLVWGEARPGRRAAVLLTFAASLLVLTKPAYAPLALLVFLVPRSRMRVGARLVYAMAVAAATALSVVVALGVDLPVRLDVHVDREAQIRGALESPLRVAGILAEDYLRYSDRYLAQMIGQLGWLDANLPKLLIIAYALLVAAMLLCDGDPAVRVSARQRIVISAAVIATLTVISASLYALWTPVGAATLEGIQGRYFLPIAPLALWAVHVARRGPWRGLERVLPWLHLGMAAVALWVMLARYYG